MITNVLLKTASPLLSLFIFMLSNGLFSTLLTVRMYQLGDSAIAIGMVTAAYYAGLLVGSLRIEQFIIRVGHIRAFAVFASTLGVTCLLQGIFVDPWFWIAMRFVGGFATAGLFIVIESWLLIMGNATIRGQVLALYMIALYAAQASGQFLLNLSDPSSLVPFIITGILCSLSVIPVAMTSVASPTFEQPSALNFRKLYRISPSGIFGAIASGLLLGAIYGLVPLFLTQNEYSVADIAFLMAMVIFGGMALQYPVGKLSDHFDRRQIIIILCLLIVMISAIIMFSVRQYLLLLGAAFFIFGGLTFTLYPVSISHACDSLDSKDITAATQGLMLSYSIGATVGPLLAPFFIKTIGPIGLFIYFSVVASGLGCLLVWRKFCKAAIPAAKHVEFVSMPQTTPVLSELDPRGDGSNHPS